MRAVSFVKKLQWELPGTVCRHGLTIGDVDNDGDNELVVGTVEGELHIFKGSELWQKITGLGLITSIAIGDIFNYGRNALVVICGDGWAHIFYSPKSVNPNNAPILSTQLFKDQEQEQENFKTAINYVNADINMGNNTVSSGNMDHVDNTDEMNELSGKMECVHIQRIPTNTKIVLVADIDKDGANEMIIGLTDRVVRSYRWSSNADLGTGKLIGLNKWECANQIGTVTLQYTSNDIPTLLVAQPGGTFMRIMCSSKDNCLEDDGNDGNKKIAASCVDYQTLGISRMRNQNISTEIIGNLKSGITSFFSSLGTQSSKHVIKEKLVKQSAVDDSHIFSKNFKPSSLQFKQNHSQPTTRKNSFDETNENEIKYLVTQSHGFVRLYNTTESSSIDQVDGNILGGNIILGEFDSKIKKDLSLPSFEDFTCISGIKLEQDKQNKDEVKYVVNKDNYSRGKPYALATLDGTIMLVKDEIILWAMQVDHQIFALCQLDVTGDGFDEIVACAWDGQTYILDQQRNSVRFQFEEPVRAFCTGNYSVTAHTSTPCLVYNTFNNKIFLYYDVMLPSMVISPLNPTEDLNAEEKELLNEILGACNEPEKRQRMQQFTEWLLYGRH